MCAGLPSAAGVLKVGELEELLVGVKTLLLKNTGLCGLSVGGKLVSHAAGALDGTGSLQDGRSWRVYTSGLSGKLKEGL